VSSESNYLLTPSRYPDYPLTRACHSERIDRALSRESGNGECLDHRSPLVMVLGAYRCWSACGPSGPRRLSAWGSISAI